MPITMQKIPGPELDKLYPKDAEKIRMDIPAVEVVDAVLEAPGPGGSQVPVGWALVWLVSLCSPG